MSLRERAAAAQQGGVSTDVAINQAADVQGAAEPRPSIVGFVQNLRPMLAEALPKTMSADRVARLALTEVRKNPKLAASTPESFAGSLLTAAALGLEVGTTGEAYLIPYEIRKGALKGNVECQLQVGYQGFSKLFYQHPLAADIDAQAVYENDDFDWQYGTDKFLRHRPLREGDRGKVTYFYAVAHLTTGATHFVVLTAAEVRTLRQGKVGPSGDIADPQLWMERKTAVKQCLKMLPKSAQLSAAMAAEDTSGAELYRTRVEQVRFEQQQIGSGEKAPQAAAPAPSSGPSDADVPPDPHDPDDPWTPRSITEDQRTRIHASLADLNITDRDAKLLFYADVVGHPVESSNDLTLSEASQVIEALNAGLAEAGIEVRP